MDPADGSIPAIAYTDEEKAALASGVTPEQIAYRRVFFAKQRKDVEAHAHDTLWTPIHPRGIFTIPRSLPFGVRQLVSLLLLIVYPLWLLFFLTVLVIGRIFYAFLWVLFSPLALWRKHNNPVEYARAKEETEKVKLDFVLGKLPTPTEPAEGLDR